MKKTISLIPVVLAVVLLIIFAPLLTQPAEAQIYYYTPTADANGNVIYTVREGDSCESIALLNGISTETLQSLNNLNADGCKFLTAGTRLRLAIVPTAVITPGPSPTPTSPIPTAQPASGFGTLCVYLFNDINGNGMVDTGEGPIAGGQFNISSAASNTSLSGTSIATATLDPVCFENLPESHYTISMAIPEGYNATSSQSVSIDLKAGDTATVNFSAQSSSRSGATQQQGGGKSILLAIVGGLVLIAGVGLGLYVRLLMVKSSK